MANLYSVPLKNSVQKTLAGTLTQAEVGTITLDSSVALELQATSSMKGLLVIDRVDVNGVLTPTKTEYISYTGVSGSTVTGLTRALAGTSAQGHSIGAIVEFVPDITWGQAINDVITEQHNSDGTHKTLSLISLASVTINNSNINIPFITGGSAISLAINYSRLENITLDGTSQYNSNIFGASLASMTAVGRAYIPVETKLISTVSDGATITFDLATSNIFSVTLGGALRNLVITNPTEGQSFIVRLVQDATGSKTVNFFSTIKWSGGIVPTLQTAIDKTDVFGFLCTASGYYDGFIVGQNL
jgi:hypothetical protein